jgi:uncharacterized membrane protein (UPF0136 family)
MVNAAKKAATIPMPIKARGFMPGEDLVAVENPATEIRYLDENEYIRHKVLMRGAGQRLCVALPIRLMLGAAKVYFIVFGILTIAGGILGYVKAGSVISVIAGSISGILLLLAAWLMPDYQAAGLIVALVISVLLAGQFVPKFFSTHKVMPEGLMSVLSVLGIVVAVAAWLRK